MEQRQRLGMKHLAVDREVTDPGNLRASVNTVAEDRESQVREMHADLVRPSRLDLDFNERRVLEPLLDLEEGDSLARARGVDADLFPLLHMPSDRRFDPA